jgi:hypothetical protein
MEVLKPLSELTDPDQRNLYFVVTDSSSAARRLSLQEIHGIASSVTLHEGVPEAVRSHFSQAQNLAVYSWFHYPFNVTSQLLAFISVEFALRHRFKSDDSFKNLIARAVNEGLIRGSGFAITANRDEALEPYVETLVKVMPTLRNKVAHGSSMLHNNSLSSLRICAEFINQLFPLVHGVA